MAVDVLLGLQWGDEGKGKIVDFIATGYDIVARFQGGPNAGHTLVFDGIKHVLHQIPSGIFHPETINIIGNGVVLDPIVFKKEVQALTSLGIGNKGNLLVSKRAQIILPTHRLLDRASEAMKGDSKIGSTLKGIGPTYEDKYGRQGLRVGDLIAENFSEKYEILKAKHLHRLQNIYNYDVTELPAMEAEFFQAVEFMKELQITDTEYILNDALSKGKTILAEGAQGTLLDIDFGSYPYVTSSSTTAAGACTGLGVAPGHIQQVYGVFKAYCTRVGGGPFPTELNDEVGEEIRKAGHEFGSTTGRPRRCGWLDLPALKYAVMINKATRLLMMKADVLNGFETIKVCTHYKLADGSVTDSLPYDLLATQVEPIYKEMKGWNCSLEGRKYFDQLPEELHTYIAYIEEVVGVPITLVSTGPDRKQTIIR